MERTQELDKVLEELKRVTGLSVHVTAGTPDETEYALKQLRCLCTAYKEKYNLTDFLQSLMTGGIPAYEIPDRAARLHINPEAERILFLLESKAENGTILEILKNLFPTQTKVYLIPVTETLTAVLHPVQDCKNTEQFGHISRTIIDTLNAEALTHVQLSYSSVFSTLSELSKAFRETSLALRVGKLFYSEQTIFPYNALGIGRLIYQLPPSLCESFLGEIFGENIPDTFEPETIATINRFFQNNLNIAETSRQLHMHRNTLIYRLEQIQKRTGLDLRIFEDAMTFKVATLVMNYLHAERNK